MAAQVIHYNISRRGGAKSYFFFNVALSFLLDPADMLDLHQRNAPTPTRTIFGHAVRSMSSSILQSRRVESGRPTSSRNMYPIVTPLRSPFDHQPATRRELKVCCLSRSARARGVLV